MTRRQVNLIAWACGTAGGFLFGVLCLAAEQVFS